MSKYKCVMQHDDTDCAAACLSTISKYYKIDVPIYKLRELCKTDNIGTNLYGLISAAKEIGFITKAVKATMKEDILKDFNKPAIAHIINDNDQLHYVVIYKVTKKKIIIADPNEGIVKYTIDEFKNIWTGYLLVLVPSVNMKTFSTDDSDGVNLLKQLIKMNSDVILQIIFLSLFLSLLGFLSTFYTKILLDDIFPMNSYSNLVTISLIFFSISVVTIILNFINSYIGLYFKYKLTIPLELSSINHMLKLPISFFQTRTTGEILARIADVETVASLVSTISIQLVINSIMAFIGSIVLFVFNRSLFLLGCLSIIIYLIIFRLFKNGIHKKTKRSIIQNEKLNQYSIDFIKSIESIKSTRSEEMINNQYQFMLSKTIKCEIDFSKYMITYSTLISSIKIILNSIIGYVVATIVLDGKITIGTMLMFSTIFSLFITPLESIINLQPNIESMKVSLNRLKEIFLIEKERELSKIKLKDLKKDIVIKNLEYWYSNDKPAIKNINMNIKNNSMVAFVGESGSGKTTLAKMLVSFYVPDKGEILFNDINITNLSVDFLRQNIAFVNQNVQFIKDSILNNLTIGLDDFDFEYVIYLCKMVGIHEKISTLEFGYDTELSEDGKNLSQGEKQRLNLIRGLLMKPNILILDEATSNLDYLTEKKVLNLLEELSPNMTIIIITHRLKCIKNCDEIFFMDKGEIIENGTHEKLMSNYKEYYKMYTSQ